MTEATVPALVLEDLVHRYGAMVALDHISLTVADGEFVTILGPSGSGKTTLLRVIGGFENVSSAASLQIAGADVLGLPANHRPVATVFQQYALFPHMRVGENVEYGLKLRRIAPDERRRRAKEALDLVRLSGKYDRRIHELSGGERQRVAFARAFVIEPRILLLDEPMGALDEKLRREMQIEVRSLQRTLGTTFVQVTHSQEEALTMSDRIVVMNRGRIEQIGAPRAIFEAPATRFVADFMGLRNIFEGPVTRVEGNEVEIQHGTSRLRGRWTGADRPTVGSSAFFAVHPRNVQISGGVQPSSSSSVIRGKLRSAAYKGADMEVEFDTPLGPMTSATPMTTASDEIDATWSPDLAVVGPLSATSTREAA